MEAILLVGPESPFLRILATVLSRGWSVSAASDRNALQQVLSSCQPAVIVFDHTQPTDLFDLNPRSFGFNGPILLLADEPVVARELLEADVFLRRPTDLVILSRLIEQLVNGRRND